MFGSQMCTFGDCRHPIFDRPQDLGVTDGLLDGERCAKQKFDFFSKRGVKYQLHTPFWTKAILNGF